MAGQPANNEPVVRELEEVWASIILACDRVQSDQWELATDCPGWSVKDQVSHLIGIERMLLGDPSPPELADLPAHVRNPFGALNEAWVEARRGVPAGEVLAEFVTVTGRRAEALRGMPFEEFERIGWSPIGDVPYREFMETRVLDSWAHEQDIRRALGRPGGRNGPGESIVLDRCERSMPYVVGKRAAVPDGTAVLFVVTGVLGRRFLIAVDGGRAAPVDSDSPAAPATPAAPAAPAASPAPVNSAAPVGTPLPTVSLSFDQESFWRLSFGRVTPAEMVASGQTRVGGDVRLGNRVLESMAFMQ